MVLLVLAFPFPFPDRTCAIVLNDNNNTVIFGNDRDRNGGGLMLIILLVAMLTWVISFLIIRAISRYREFAADRGSAQMTGYYSDHGASTLIGAAGSKAFSPNPITVKVGGTVTWTNKDTQAHTVVSGTGPSDPNKGRVFDSGLTTLIQSGKTFSHTFTTAGTIPYFCQIHPTMVGKIIVT
jgi:plastocyanin